MPTGSPLPPPRARSVSRAPRLRPALTAMALGLAAASTLATTLATGSAAAAGDDAKGSLAQLRQVFVEGRALEDKGEWAAALDKFKEVAAAKMTPQVRFHMALCEENLGKLVSAMRGFDLAAAEGTAAGSAAVEVPPAAKQHVEALRARVARLEIDVGGKISTSKIQLDGVALGDKEIGVQIDVDPGAHVIEVRDASGKSTFRKELTLAEKGESKLEVPVDDKDEAPTAPPPPDAPASSSSRAPAYVIGGIGLGALVGSGIFFGLRAANIATVSSHCADPGSYVGCQPGDASLISQGKAFTGVADTLLGVGLAGVATGTILYFVLAPKKRSADPPPSASLMILPAGSGLKVIGAF